MTREEALLKLYEYMRFIRGTISEKYYGEALNMAISKLREPERKRGKWIDGDVLMCSECGRWIDVLQGDADMNYCPNCGADMRGDSDEA